MSAPPSPTGGWSDPDQVTWYLERIGKLEARRSGEQMLAELLPAAPTRVLDLGCGDGRLTELVLAARPSVASCIAIDRSEPMLAAARMRFGQQPLVDVRFWDLADPVTSFGSFDVIVSGFAIHHLANDRKRELFAEVATMLSPGGVFANLEVVASATPAHHAAFLAAIGRTEEDPEDQLVAVGTQLQWMRDVGMIEVDCLWRWRGFALLVGEQAR